MAKNVGPKIKVEPIPDPDNLNPQSPAEFFERGWLFYSHQKFEQAEADFRLVLERESANVDAWYSLGLTLKAEGKAQPAIEAFSHIDQVINEIEDSQRATIVSRLTHGQINQIRTGNWNLENEIWKSKSKK